VTLRAGIYGRESTGEFKSINDQLKLGFAAVTDKGWTLAGKYEDDSSASIFRTEEREDWARLLTDLSAGRLDVLVLWKVARGSRDEIDWFPLLRTCADRGVLIHILADDRTYDPRDGRDWKTLADEGITAAYYSRQLSKDVRRGQLMAALDGRPHGDAPFGYSRAYDENKTPLRVPNEHVPIVREIFERLDKATPILEIEEDFRRRDVPSPSGGVWHRKTIRYIATNVAYIGRRRLKNGDLVEATWTAVVDADRFWRVQRLLNDPDRVMTKPGKAKYLLSYLAETPCGGKIQYRLPPGRSLQAAVYICVRNGCVSVPARDADALVERLIFSRLKDPKALAHFVKDDVEIKAAQAELAQLEEQMEKAYASYERPNGISEEALARKERALRPLIAATRERAAPKGIAGVIGKLASAPNPEEQWRKLSVAAQRSVVAALTALNVGRATRRLPRTDAAARMEETLARFGGSTWAGDDRTWAELAADAVG
jgi:site-specific DNA recombinase